MFAYPPGKFIAALNIRLVGRTRSGCSIDYLLTNIYDERNEAVKLLISNVIKVAKKKKKYIGICGQAPSDYPEFTRFLVKEGIESISLNPDSVIKTIPIVSSSEKKK